MLTLDPSTQTHLGGLIRQLEDEFETISTLDADARNLQREIADAEQKYQQLTAQIGEAKYEEQMRKYGVDSRFLESQRQQLDQELLGLQSHNENRAKLDVKRQDLQTRRQEIDTT